MFAYSADQIRAAEKALMAHEVADDEMMKLAAAAVADTALDMLRAQSSDKVVVVAGPGGNGGDGLFAATHLLLAGYRVHAVPVATRADGSPKVHPAAWQAFRAAGGELLGTGELAELADSAQAPALIIDAIAGLSAGRGLDGAIAEFFHTQRRLGTDVLAVDVPTGVHCDTGDTAPETAAREATSTAASTDQDAAPCERQPGDSYVRATVTISFGAGRLAHAATPVCGKVVIADLQLPQGPRSFAEELAHQNPVGQSAAIAHEDGEHGEDERHVTEFFQVPALATRTQIQARASASGSATAPPQQPELPEFQHATVGVGSGPGNLEPQPAGDKYSSGVVGVCAGSAAYPGAGILATAGAIAATPSMVRVIGPAELTRDVVRAHPEAVTHASVRTAGRVQALVVGPGRGTDISAALELEYALQGTQPLVLDADAITLLAASAQLRELLRDRASTSPVLLTPHDGEFQRLADALPAPDQDASTNDATDRLRATRALATQLNAWVLRKGRITLIASPDGRLVSVNTGSSWAATPGSGDVLSGILGAFLAEWNAPAATPETKHNGVAQADLADVFRRAVVVHSWAAQLAAQTEFGMAPTSASAIATAIPRALAYFTSQEDQ
ncbi:bifunctional ADP-dependent NAD(P)H-hydrate dehydratase/NAD(P)H-hydrate epimerase [Corynebacterium pseudodiphtheriticum]|uniref:bifunctional ADP-dependent NAD(P)H-hydrate dehydratase/NAD(P)H-hydrate epimerase n=1 Tax=Corynebacterium pseudodiphtheriticum TaxID=37637 RepID=UPI001F618A76|nr:bifunctional ADP-dependent NAD(P)H-hydrate dehydratase/NAD(P)H-hydrate epimerase [Corynebacterium pseudodiphtheriticum]MDK4321865.1 bifunctional ADP-dependent NAD(P)H-hydrate dehydratase/NAD(P)H-hydrate epimerase [Corynebacterium pseudodiphtheriticum]UNU75230.1 bifunctional ADP-dependent NAD(P)H-hydrate dehydratase/NAD(P)H-hydrate epimerase [Corynebacterium pseudodiphtheriticum]UNU77499.1 bifunctional ADP-dependent NAD(P)H-hydrate dehydratase/NAD(P)H-hydrate epimerase [Corynebacterium pseudod